MRTLIVDDDFPVRMLFKQIIDWEEEGFQIVGEAIDGAEGLEKVRDLQPDLIIVDIEMPRMNGVQMIGELMEQGYQGQIIVVSCHDDFKYVKEALKLGAKDYLLKDHINQDKLLEVLAIVRRDYNATKEKKIEQNKIKRWANKGKQTLKKDYLKNVLLGINKNSKDIKKQIDQLSIHMSKKLNGVVAIEIDHYDEQVIKISAKKDRELFNFTIRNIIEEILENLNLKGEVVEFGKRYFAIIIDLENMISRNQQRSTMMTFTDRIHKSVKKYLDIELTALYDYGVEGVEGIPVAYERVKKGVRNKFYKGIGTVEDIKDLSPLRMKALKISKEAEKEISEFIGQGDEESLIGILKDGVNLASNENISPEKVYIYVKQWMSLLDKICIQYGIDLNGLMESEGIVRASLERGETAEEIYQDMVRLIKAIASRFNHEDVHSSHYLIKEIVKYINCNYMKDLTLYSISEHFGKNMTYVSHLFKQEMGEGFTDYMKSVRMKNAEQLMRTTDLKISDIATQVGIPNRKYFTKLFKEKMGTSPSEFRKGIQS